MKAHNWNKLAHTFGTKYQYTNIHSIPNDNGDIIVNSFQAFMQDIGLTYYIVTDNHKSMTGDKKDIHHLKTENCSHWQNSAKGI